MVEARSYCPCSMVLAGTAYAALLSRTFSPWQECRHAHVEMRLTLASRMRSDRYRCHVRSLAVGGLRRGRESGVRGSKNTPPS